MKPIDLRSDTVTRPSSAMLDAMMAAEIGDDVYGEDPTVNALERLSAEMLGKESAIFCTSGTQSNLMGLLAHCQRGDEYIVGQGAHTYLFEGGGAAVLGSIQPQPLQAEKDGTLDLNKVTRLIKPNDYHFARTRLLCLENTHRGIVLPVDYIKEASELALKHQLGFHLDGARIFNAAVKDGIDVKEICIHFDTISCCLSKGLGAPVGSVLCGSREAIAEARKWRKMLGGGMRQAGILAAAGIYALKNNIERLKTDHENAYVLASELNELDEINIDISLVQTNMIFARMDTDMSQLCHFMENKGILIDNGNPVRLVTHLDISREDISQVISAFKSYFS